VFVPAKPFQLSIMFMIKDGVYLTEAPFMCSTLEKAPAQKQLNRLKKLARDEHARLLRKLVNYGRKKFYNIGPKKTGKATTNPIKLFWRNLRQHRHKVSTFV
jgi:hypothetical protein